MTKESDAFETITDGWGKTIKLPKLAKKPLVDPDWFVAKLAKQANEPKKIEPPDEDPPAKPKPTRKAPKQDIRIGRCPLCRRHYGVVLTKEESDAHPDREEVIERICDRHQRK